MKRVVVPKNANVDVDYRRAVFLLKNKFNSASDLVKFWSFCGPCHEKYPDIEKIRKNI
jgi:hypothetical protein